MILIFLRSLLFTIIFFGVLYPLLTLGALTLIGPKWLYVKIPFWWTRLLFVMLRICTGIRYELRGMKAEYRTSPFIFASKHQSTWETFAFNVFFHDPAFVMKKSLFWVPPFGWFLARLNMIPVDRSEGMKAIKSLITYTQRALKEGRPVIIYPEGTRTQPGDAPSYKSGIYVLYKQCNVAVVPIAINAGCLWGRRQFLKRPGTIVVEFLPPIEEGLSREAFMKTLETRIEEAAQNLYT